MPAKDRQGPEEHQQWKLPCSLPFRVSGQTQSADGRGASPL